MTPKAQAARRARWIPWMFVLGFAVVVAANGIMIHFALSTWSGLTASEPYTKGLRHNAELAAEARQAALGWSAAHEFRAETGLAGRLVIVLADRDGNPVDGAEVSARLVRPAQQGLDRDVALAPASRGRYEAAVTLPLPGLWEIRYRVRRGADEFHAVARIEAKP
jgi:nitrogen fixation protein FixH